MSNSPSFSFTEKALAFSVHLFTSSGLIAAFMAMRAIMNGAWRETMVWLIITLVIDGIDGTFARMFRVKEVLPNFDGQTIDYVIDFATYAIIPAFFIYAAQFPTGEYLLPEEEWIRIVAAAIILLVSALYYAKEGMVSHDMYFVGFPVMWNMVAFYLFFIWGFSGWINFGMVLFFAILHFVPIKYPYPSRKNEWFYPTLINTVLFITLNLVVLAIYPNAPLWLKIVSFFSMLYFGFIAIMKTYVWDRKSNAIEIN